MESEKDSAVKLGDKVVGKIDLPKLDVSEYIGQRVKIVDVKEYAGKVYEGKQSYYIRIKAEPVKVLDDGTEICPSRLVSLQTDAEGQIGWGEGTRMDELLKKYKVEHYNDLIGKEVIVQSTTKNGNEFLTF